MLWDWMRRFPLLSDVVIAVAALGTVAAAATGDQQPGLRAVVCAVAAVPLFWRRQRPLAVLTLVAAATVLMVLLNAWFVPWQLAVALYAVAERSSRRPAIAGVVCSVGAVAAAALTEPQMRPGDLLWRLVFLAAAWLLGDAIGTRRAYVRELEGKADALAAEHEARTRQIAAEEQARIARELHDVVAHSLTVIIVQAGAAQDALSDAPGPAREPLAAIATAARTALGDLRRVVTTLRDGAAELEPQPSMGQLSPMVDTIRDAGLPVEVTIHGRPRELPASVDLSAYRIIQEALTNTLKHADATQVRVLVRYGEALEVEIEDDGRPSTGATETSPGSQSGTGTGLIGMRERVAMLGGDLTVAPGPDGGFRVHATIPTGTP